MKIKYFLSFVIPVVLSHLFCNSVSGQQLDQIGKKGGIKLSGGLGVNQTLYFANGISNRFNPYSYVISGNLAASVYGISIPVSFAFSNQKLRYNAQPFNIVGVSPSYKNLRLHAGYRNMTFSPYTLNGHSFLGGGLEWSYKKFQVAAMGGRLLKGVEYDSTRNIEPVYARHGGGLKIGYSDKGEEVTLISFYAKDDAGSIAQPPLTKGVRPMENQVYSLLLKKRIHEKIQVHFEGATSAWTKDTRDSLSENSRHLYKILYLMPLKNNTVFYNAFKTGFTFALKKGTLGLSFERVEPGFRTMGAYYFNSDFQNLTGNYSTTLLKNKLSLGLNAGVQRDDLDNEKLSRMKRFVGSINLGMKFSEKINVSGMYSNFNSFTNVKPVDQAFIQNTPYDRIDTLNYMQISQTINLGANIKPLENTRLVHNLSLGGNYNDVFSKTGGSKTANGMSAAYLSYNINWKETGLILGLNVNGNQNTYATGKAYFFGAGANTGMAFFKKKIRGNLSANYSNNYEGKILTANLYSIINTYSMRLGKHHSLNFNLRYTGRVSRKQAELSYYKQSFTEFMGTLGYNFSF